MPQVDNDRDGLALELLLEETLTLKVAVPLLLNDETRLGVDEGDAVAKTDTDADALAERVVLSVGEEDCEDTSDADGSALRVKAYVVGRADEVVVIDAEPLVE